MQSPKSLIIVGTGAAVPLSASHLGARWITLQAKSDNASDVLVGGDGVVAPAFPLAAGDSLTFSPNGTEPMGFYFLDEAHVIVANSDHLYVLYGG